MEYRQRGGNHQQVKKKRIFVPKQEALPASPQYTGHSAGLHGEDAPYTTTADVHTRVPATRPPQTPDDYEAGSFIAQMTRRYDSVQMPDGVLLRQGNEQVYLHQPKKVDPRRPVIERAGRNRQPPTTDAVPLLPPGRNQKPSRLHWLFFVGIGSLVMLVGYIGVTAFGSWWQNHQNDATYGYPRTFQTDAVVGHSDSPQHPTHFIAVNLHQHIIIVELPGGDLSKSVMYSAGVVFGTGQDLTPVTLSFLDTNHNGKPEMLVHIADQTIVFANNGTKFVPPSNLVTGGSNPPTQGE